MKQTGKKVFVGLSGGVDSSVSAALLKEAGYDVTGVFIKTWYPDFLTCNWKEERRDAMRVCAKLNIPFLTCDGEHAYKQGVVDYMINEYKKGRTPNPDVMCNKSVKFGVFLTFALEHGADYVATGHYAQVKDGSLAMGKDQNKDQSYFLWTLTKEQLSHILFPIGHLEKPEVRKLAAKFGLHTSTKKDSQGVCFLGNIDMKAFLKHYITPHEGNVLNQQGEVIGHHDGVEFLTIGERHGFTISKKGTDDAPLYIIAKDIETNMVTVSTEPIALDVSKKEINLESLHWTHLPIVPGIYDARLRYRQELFKINITEKGDISFIDEPQPTTSGQSLVMYKDEVCKGGGIIA